jgi:hypothetical protein
MVDFATMQQPYLHGETKLNVWKNARKQPYLTVLKRVLADFELTQV